MVVIFTNMNQIINCLHYFHLYILTLNCSNGKFSYSAVAIVLHCYFRMRKNKYYAIFILLNITTKTVFNCSAYVQIPLGRINKYLEYQDMSFSEGKGNIYTKTELVFF